MGHDVEMGAPSAPLPAPLAFSPGAQRVGICASGLHVVSETTSGLRLLQPDLCLIFFCFPTYCWMGKSGQCWLQLCLQFQEGGRMPPHPHPNLGPSHILQSDFMRKPSLWAFDVLDCSVLSCMPPPSTHLCPSHLFYSACFLCFVALFIF